MLPSLSNLKEYEALVRESIETGSCDLFRNASAAHAAIIMRLFCEYAKRTVHIFCGRMNREVYGALRESFAEAIARGVEVQFITEELFEHLESGDVARYLRERGALRCYGEKQDIAHFSVVDGRMFRVEADREKKSALVGTNVDPEDTERLETLKAMEEAFNRLWSEAPVPV